MGMTGRFGENIPDDAFRKRTGSLILFPDHLHPHAGGNVRSALSFHASLLCSRILLQEKNIFRRRSCISVMPIEIFSLYRWVSVERLLNALSARTPAYGYGGLLILRRISR